MSFDQLLLWAETQCEMPGDVNDTIGVMLDRSGYRGALLGALIGDVLGAPFEGRRGLVGEDAIASLFRGTSVLPFTDDTALTLALAQSLLGAGGLVEDHLAAAFADAWASAPDIGYSSGTSAFLSAVRAHGGRARTLMRNGRASNGAAMRVTPISLWTRGGSDTAELARRSALATHDHLGAADGAIAQAVAVAAALRHPTGQPVNAAEFAAKVRAAVSDPLLDAKLGLAAELSRRPDAGEIARHIGTGLLAAESVAAALCAFLCHPDSFADAVALAIRLGGDTDTIASMTGAISGALLGEESIPTRWLERTVMASRVRELADALYVATA